MVNINWCCKQKNGLNLIDKNENLSTAYLEMAKDSINVMKNEKDQSLRWSISSCYYSMYYSLYAILMKIGIKSEIHSCTLEFMGCFLPYSSNDYKLIQKAFKLRNTIQYYAERVINKKDAEEIISGAEEFFNISKEIIASLNEEQINEIRKKLKEYF